MFCVSPSLKITCLDPFRVVLQETGLVMWQLRWRLLLRRSKAMEALNQETTLVGQTYLEYKINLHE